MADVLSARSPVEATDAVMAAGSIGRGSGRFALDSVKIIPSGGDALALVGLDIMGRMRPDREHQLREVLKSFDGYDLILVDCPPLPGVLACNELSMLTANGLAAADCALVIPSRFPRTRSRVPHLLEMIEDVQKYSNPSLTLAGMMVWEYQDECEYWPEWLATKQSTSTLADRIDQGRCSGSPKTVYPGEQVYDEYLAKLLKDHRAEP